MRGILKFSLEITGKNNLYGRLCARCISSSFVFNNKFEDVSSMDAPSVKIGESVVDVTNMYWKGESLILTIKCPKPSPTQPDYTVSAVLNLGGKPDGNSWIRKGDYLVTTSRATSGAGRNDRNTSGQPENKFIYHIEIYQL